MPKANLKYQPYVNFCLVFGIPFFCVVLFGAFLINDFKLYYREVIAFGALTFIVFTSVILVSPIWLQKVLRYISFTVLLLLAIVKLLFFYVFGKKIGVAAFFSFFETHQSEVKEFFSTYFNSYLYASIVLVFLGAYYLLFNSKIFKTFHWKLNFRIKSVVILVAISCCLLINYKLPAENIPLVFYNSYKSYKTYTTNLNNNLSQPKSEFISAITSKDFAQTYVVVIGESTTKNRMQLYGYDRATNPLLTNLKDNLFVFKDVISPHAHTIFALDKILTLNSHNNTSLIQNISVVQLANSAGFKTYWLSNQDPIGDNETISAIVSNAADERYYVSQFSSYDELILPKLNAILDSEIQKKVIFIHLMGTHLFYNNRYPPEFNFFKDLKPNSAYTHNTAITTVNAYDNAVRYNDFIVDSIIKTVAVKANYSTVLYFSDHGDEVYDSQDFSGHNALEPTNNMYEIPFMVWASEEFKINNHTKLNVLKNNITLKYNLEDFIYSFSDLSGISFSGFNPEKSIFNINFKEKKRWVENDILYDSE